MNCEICGDKLYAKGKCRKHYMNDYMKEYNKTEKSKEYRKKYYLERRKKKKEEEEKV